MWYSIKDTADKNMAVLEIERVAMLQWLAGSILQSSSLSDKTVNRGPFSMT